MRAFLPAGFTVKVESLPPRYLLKTSVMWSARCCGVWPAPHSRMMKQVLLPMDTDALVALGAAAATEATSVPISRNDERNPFIGSCFLSSRANGAGRE